jgi:hypothetical protein
VTAAPPARWRDQRGLTIALTILFSLMVASAALLAVALANRISVVRDFRDGHFGTDILERADDADDFVSGASAAFVLTQVAIAVLFIIWLFRAAKNNEALGRVGARFTPGWSIGSWFIPLANFVIPVLIVQDLWRGSSAESRRGDPLWRTGRGSALVGWWWAAGWSRCCASYSVPPARQRLARRHRDEQHVALIGVVVLRSPVLAGGAHPSRRQLDALRARTAYEAAPA